MAVALTVASGMSFAVYLKIVNMAHEQCAASGGNWTRGLTRLSIVAALLLAARTIDWMTLADH